VSVFTYIALLGREVTSTIRYRAEKRAEARELEAEQARDRAKADRLFEEETRLEAEETSARRTYRRSRDSYGRDRGFDFGSWGGNDLWDDVAASDEDFRPRRDEFGQRHWG